MKLFIFALCLVASSIAITFSSDHLEGCEHRTFQVGQGSCHTVLYSVKKRDDSLYKTLVFCDMGSSSRSAPTKLMFHQKNFSTPIFERKKESKIGELGVFSFEGLDDLSKPSSSGSLQLSEESSDGSDLTTDHKDQFNAVKMTKEIEDYLTGVDSCIIVLTHPDKDHVNLYTDIFGSVQKPILLICGGMWAEHKTNEVDEILDSIKDQDNVKAIFPSYLDHVRHDDLKKHGKTVTTPLCGEHGDLLSFVQRYCTDYNYIEHFRLKAKKKKNLPKKTFEDLILKNIYFWSVKHLSDDTNAQSLIFSCTLPDIKTSFVFTGDATPETFESISVDTKDQLRESYKPTDTFKEGSIPVKTHKVCFVIPHHGALGHYSQKACDLFKPDILLFSAGYIGNFNHPNKINILRYLKYIRQLWGKRETPFLKEYKLESEEYRVAMFDIKKGSYVLRNLKDKAIVLLGTNVFGSILINENGVYTSGNNEASDGYYMEFRQCVASCDAGDKIFKNDQIDKKFLVGDKSSTVAKIKFSTKPDKNGEYTSMDKKYKLIKKSGGKQKEAKDCYYLCIKATGQ